MWALLIHTVAASWVTAVSCIWLAACLSIGRMPMYVAEGPDRLLVGYWLSLYKISFVLIFVSTAASLLAIIKYKSIVAAVILSVTLALLIFPPYFVQWYFD